MNERNNNVCTTLNSISKSVIWPGLVRLALDEIYLFEEYYNQK